MFDCLEHWGAWELEGVVSQCYIADSNYPWWFVEFHEDGSVVIVD